MNKIDWDKVKWFDPITLYDGEAVRFVERIGTAIIVVGRSGYKRVVQEYQCVRHVPVNTLQV